MYYQLPHCTFWHGGALGAARRASGLASSLPGQLWGGSVPCLQEMRDKAAAPAVPAAGRAPCLRPKDAVFCFQACPPFTVALFFPVVRSAGSGAQWCSQRTHGAWG